jgi:hypothetical protein
LKRPRAVRALAGRCEMDLEHHEMDERLLIQPLVDP